MTRGEVSHGVVLGVPGRVLADRHLLRLPLPGGRPAEGCLDPVPQPARVTDLGVAR